LAAALGPRVRRDGSLRDFTALRVGGPADLLVVCERIEDLLRAVRLSRTYGVPWLVVGSGCNVLVSDAGVRGLVIVNRAARIEFDNGRSHAASERADGRRSDERIAWAEAGALIAALARGTAERGLGGIEWAAGLPGTVGGAVVGNAGAFEGDIAGTLQSATVLEPDGDIVERSVDWFEFEYRTSRIKREGDQGGGVRRLDDGAHVVLAATFGLSPGDPSALADRASEILEWRRTRHPSGATMGSTFKNPPGSHAGYLIEQAGLRGYRIGGAQISEQHGNFFMNTGAATAEDVLALIEHARAAVKRQFGVEMDLEIELVGW
jgi:UDP-N-acetylmuramate dehydrogenase